MPIVAREKHLQWSPAAGCHELLGRRCYSLNSRVPLSDKIFSTLVTMHMNHMI